MTEHSSPEPPPGSRTGGTRGAHRAPRPRRGLLAVGLVVALVLAVTAVALLVRQDGGRTSMEAGPGSEAAAGSRADGMDDGVDDVVADVADWVEAELPPDATLTAPDELRDALTAAGLAGDRVSGEDTGALQVVEGDPGADAVVVARFRGEDDRLLSVVDPRPGQPTAEELERRQRLSAAVLANPVTGAAGRAAEVLRAGNVDARLLGLLAVLVARLDVGIADFPPAPGQPEGDTPARRVLLDRAGGEELVPGSAAAERVRAFVAAQRVPFLPDTVEVTEDGVLVGFDYSPSPDAAVTAATR